MRHWGVMLACGLGLAACKKKVDNAQIEKTIANGLVATGIEKSEVTCPDNVEAKTGASFMCQVSVEGTTYQVQIDISDVKDTTFHYNTKFVDGEFYFLRKKLLDLLVPAVKEKIGTEPTIDCGSAPLLFPKDNKIYCAISQGENKGKLRVDTSGIDVTGWEIEAP